MLVPRKVFGVAKVSDPSSTRYALGGVQFERTAEGPVAVATDGRRLLAVTWPEEKGEKFPDGERDHVEGFTTIVPTKACQDAQRAMGLKIGKGVKPIFHNVLIEEPTANGKVPLVSHNGEEVRRAEPKACEGRFPQWRQIVKRHDETDSVSVELNAKLLGELLETVADLLEGDEDRGVTLTVPMKAGEPVLLSRATPSGMKLVGLIMPLYSGKKGYKAKPAWLAAPLEEGEEAQQEATEEEDEEAAEEWREEPAKLPAASKPPQVQRSRQSFEIVMGKR